MNGKLNQNQYGNRKKTVLIVAAVVLVILSVAAYLAADRYLIEHVEFEIVVPTAAANEVDGESESIAFIETDRATVAETETPNEVFHDTLTVETEIETPLVAETGLTSELAVSGEAVSAANTAGAVNRTVSTDEAVGTWRYQDDGVIIAIEHVTRGTGENRVTYFVADVVLSDVTTLQSAFAKNKFGTNIIEKVTAIAENNNAVFAINGDYYGFRTDGILIRNGIVYRNNPARIGLAIYTDGSMRVYDETQTNAEALLAEGVWNTLSFGPALIEDSVVRTDFQGTWVDTNFGNRTIERANPRTGIGLIDENHFVFIVADGRSQGYSRGLTLAEFTTIFAELGCTEAYNLDGGGSSAMYFMGGLVNHPLGRDKERGTSDILFISETESPLSHLAGAANE